MTFGAPSNGPAHLFLSMFVQIKLPMSNRASKQIFLQDTVLHMNHGNKPNQTPVLFKFMPGSRGNIKCAQERFQALTPSDMERDITLTILTTETGWRRAVMGNDPWPVLSSNHKFIGKYPQVHWDKPSAIGRIHSRDSTSVMSTVSLSAPRLGHSFSPRFWECTVSSPYNGLSLSPQCFPMVLVGMLSAYTFTFIW